MRGSEHGGMRWRDEDGDWRPLPEQTLLAGQRLLVAQDSTALLLWAEELGSLGIPMACEEADPFQRLRSAVGGWPNLNNSPPEGREFTDRILLADSLAVVIDQVVLPADGEGGIERGLAWESVPAGDGAVWRACLAPAGSTPGCANSVAAFGTLPARLTVRPAVLERSSASPWAHFLFTASPEAAAWHLEVYDLRGERVRDLWGGAVSGAEGDLHWDGRCDVRTGSSPGSLHRGLAAVPWGRRVAARGQSPGGGPMKPTRGIVFVLLFCLAAGPGRGAGLRDVQDSWLRDSLETAQLLRGEGCAKSAGWCLEAMQGLLFGLPELPQQGARWCWRGGGERAPEMGLSWQQTGTDLFRTTGMEGWLGWGRERDSAWRTARDRRIARRVNGPAGAGSPSAGTGHSAWPEDRARWAGPSFRRRRLPPEPSPR